MPPVGAFIATLISTASISAAATAATAAFTWATTGAWILTQAIMFGVSKLLAPKQNRSAGRQGDTLAMQLGENPRRAILGRVATGGDLVECWNHNSGTGDASVNRAEVLVIKLADHEVDALEGFYVNDEYYSFTGDGTVPAFDIPGWGWGLQVYFRNGAAGQTPPSSIVSTSNGNWDNDKTMTGCAHVFVRYADKKDRTIWPSGRPRFLWVVRGAKLYDPRKDSTIPGGSGAHRYATPSTWEWSNNPYLCRYNWVRGIYNRGGVTPQLMVGRGLTAQEAPPERAISRANICDELVGLKSGGTEKRYACGGMISSHDVGIDVEEWFAASMGGDIADRDGIVDIDPGEAKSAVAEVTDDDLIVGQPISFSAYLNENQRCNTVVARFVDPTQRWQDVSAPTRRDYADVISDGRPYEVSLDLPWVQSNTQAQRIAEIRRRQGRLERSFQFTLGPRFIGLECGDWIGVTSDRYLGGDRVEIVITSISLGADFKVTLTGREIAADVFDWDEDTDEIVPGTLPASNMPAPDPIEVAGFTAMASSLTTPAGVVPAIYCTWDAFEDASVTGILFQVRKDGDTKITPTEFSDVGALQAFIMAGVGAQGDFEIRARAVSLTPGRVCNWTPWTDVATGGSIFSNGLIEERSPNLAFFTRMEAGTAGYAGDPGTGTGFALSTGATNGKRWIKYAGSFTGSGQYVAVLTNFSYRFPHKAGQRYSMQVKIEATGPVSNVQLLAYRYDAAGAALSPLSTAIQTVAGAQSFGTQLAGFLTAPASADSAMFVLVLVSSGAGAASISMIEPDASLVGPDRISHPAFAPGRNAYDAADVTGGNIAAGISGQGPGATETIPSYAGNSAAFSALGAGRLFLDSTDGGKIKTTFDPVLADAAIYRQTVPFLAGATVSGTGWVQLNDIATGALTGKTIGTAAGASADPVSGATMPTNGTMNLNWRVKTGADVLLTGTMSVLQSPGDPPVVTSFAASGAAGGVLLSSAATQSLIIEVQRVSGPASLQMHGFAKAKYE